MPTLPYDDFPVASTILRERKSSGLHITIPASAPDARALRLAQLHTAVPAVVGTIAVLMIAAVPFIAILRQIRGRLPIEMFIAAIVLATAVFALAWRSLYQRRRDDLETAWSKPMLIVIQDHSVMVESNNLSLTLQRVNCRADVDEGSLLHLRMARLILADEGGSHELLAGRDLIELRWVTRQIQAGNPCGVGG